MVADTRTITPLDGLRPARAADGVGPPAADAALRVRPAVPEAPAEVEREAVARLRAVVETAVDGIITIDDRGAIETMNPAAVRLFGYTPEECIGCNVSMLMPEPYASAHDEYLGNFLRSGVRRIIGIGREVEGRRKDGSVFPIELAVSETRLGSRRIFTGIIRDITERRRADDVLHAAVQKRTAQLAAANEQLHLEIAQRERAEALLAGEKRVLELIATGASVGEALEAICLAIEGQSPGLRCAIRVSTEEAAPDTAAKIFGDTSFAALPATFPPDARQRCLIQDLHGAPGLRSWARRSSCGTLWGEPVPGSTGHGLGTVLVGFAEARAPSAYEVETVTAGARLAAISLERTAADERARRQLAELAHVARLATMGEMASGLAHELNQPLCAVANYAGACLEFLDAQAPPSEVRQALVEVARQTERAGEVIRRLREFMRRREPLRTAVDVNATVREVLGLTQTEIRHREVKVRLALSSRLPPVLADAIQIQQVLVNLVRNALEAMADVAPTSRRLRIETCRRGSCVEVAVQDAGRGIPEDARAQVFESFFTTKTHGMGMGLSISRSIVEMHEGRIWMTPNPKRGVTFHFTLPVARRKRDGQAECDGLCRG